MKRILAIVFVLQLLLTSVCVAFEPPTDKRWFWIGSTDEIGCWVDTESMEYRIDDSYSHKGHKQVDVWVLFYNLTRETSSKERSTYDLTCKKYKLNTIITYDKKGEILDSRDTSYLNFQSVVPETWSEAIFEICKIAWEKDFCNDLR